MHIPRIHAQLRRSKVNVKRFLSNTSLPQKVKNTAVKKIIPTTMIVAESFNSLSANAQNVNKTMLAYTKFNPKIIENFMPYMPKTKEKPLPLPLALRKEMGMNLTPKNKFKKNSLCIREKYNGTAEELDYFIEKLIPKRNGKKDYNPFYKKGESFIKIGNKYNINPTVLVAIGMQESGRGTSIAALRKNNIGGIYLKSGHAQFETVEECIERMAKTIDKRLKENYTTIEAIGKSGRYCDETVSELWVKNVMFFLNKM